MSKPHWSVGIQSPAMLLTASTKSSVSGYWARSRAAISPTGLVAPVLVSLCTTVMASQAPPARAASTSAGRTGWPQGTSNLTACLPQPAATSCQRWLNAPLTKLATRCPSRTPLRIAASCRPEPDAARM